MFCKKYTLAAAIFSFLISGCSSTPAIVVKAGSGEQTITAKAGKTFSIQLEAQLSTGYSWKLAEVPASLEIIKENVLTVEKDADKVGGIEIQEFIFKSMAKGDLTLTFKYAQHWDKKPKHVKSSIIKVKIE